VIGDGGAPVGEFSLLTMYVFERDSKTIYEYDLKQNKVLKRTIDMPTRFEHNF